MIDDFDYPEDLARPKAMSDTKPSAKDNRPEPANETMNALLVLREQGYLGISVAQALKIVGLAHQPSATPVPASGPREEPPSEFDRLQAQKDAIIERQRRSAFSHFDQQIRQLQMQLADPDCTGWTCPNCGRATNYKPDTECDECSFDVTPYLPAAASGLTPPAPSAGAPPVDLDAIERWLLEASEFLAEPEEQRDISALIRQLRSALASRSPEPLGICKCGHGEGVHTHNFKGEPKQYRYDCRQCDCEGYMASRSPETDTTAIRTFVKHLWDECHDGGDFERTLDAARLDKLLASRSSAATEERTREHLKAILTNAQAAIRNPKLQDAILRQIEALAGSALSVPSPAPTSEEK